MTLQIEAYLENQGEVTIMKREVPKIENWERVLRKMYDWVWKHYSSHSLVDLYALMIDEDGYHECSQAWAVEYSEQYPNFDLPFI